MSRMGLLGAIGFSLALVSLTQVSVILSKINNKSLDIIVFEIEICVADLFIHFCHVQIPHGAEGK